jgi:branched-chain amino acid transport system permease protein
MDTGSRAGTEFAAALVALAVFAALPLVVVNAYWLGVLVVAMYFAIIASAWNLLAGYTGQFSLAPAAFAMIGGYTTGLLSYHFELPPAVGIPAAVLASGLVGLVLGRVVMRLRGPYLALTTLSFGEIMRLVVSNSIEVTRGDLGLSVPGILDDRLAWYYVFLAVLAAVQVGLWLILRAPAGLYLQAVRDDEIAASSRGVDIVFWKTASFTLSSALCGLAGALYGHFAQLVSPELGLIAQSGIVISMVVIGGMGTLVGPLVGAMLVYVASEYLREFGGWQLVVFAALVIVFARFFREGLWGLLRRLVLPAPRASAAMPQSAE